MRFSSPEVLCISSCALFITGNAVVASIFLSLGVIGAVFRVGLEMQEKQQQDKAVEEAKQSFSNLGSSLGALLGAMADNSEDDAKMR